MDPTKVSAVVEWLSPTKSKQLQQFLGFAHFYHLFIINYSCIAATLTALTSPSILFCWTREVETAFIKLRHWFGSTPVLIQPDINSQFTMEFNFSDTGVGSGALPEILAKDAFTHIYTAEVWRRAIQTEVQSCPHPVLLPPIPGRLRQTRSDKPRSYKQTQVAVQLTIILSLTLSALSSCSGHIRTALSAIQPSPEPIHFSVHTSVGPPWTQTTGHSLIL